MLSGTRYLVFDRRAQLRIPEHFARQLGADLVLTHAPGGCLLLFSAAAWATFLKRQTDPDRREFFLAGAAPVRRDARGRISVPAALRHHGTLRPGSLVALAGVGTALSIAPVDVWNARLRRIETALLADLDRPPPPLWTDRVQRGIWPT